MTRRPRAHQATDDTIIYPLEHALLEAGQETGFWDDHGRPAPWTDDIDEWSPTTQEPLTLQPGQPPF